jgi:hypothetical protein
LTPRGDTPTYQHLKRHLEEYIEAFKPLNASQRDTFPGLDLIIFTDGAPESPFEDIEEVVVDTARMERPLRMAKVELAASLATAKVSGRQGRHGIVRSLLP